MLHLLYILAFTILAFLAISNLIRNLLMLSADVNRTPPYSGGSASQNPYLARQGSVEVVPHPEMLDDSGNIIREPLLVMRSITVEDARDQLDALYKASPSPSDETSNDMD